MSEIHEDRLSCSVADILHRFTADQDFKDAEDIKNTVDVLNYNPQEQPCVARICPFAEKCLQFAGVGIDLYKLRHPQAQPEVNVTVFPQSGVENT